MSDFFRSAMGYFNGPPDTSSSSATEGNGSGSFGVFGGGGGPENEFIGQLVEVDGMKLRIRTLIATGEHTGDPI